MIDINNFGSDYWLSHNKKLLPLTFITYKPIILDNNEIYFNIQLANRGKSMTGLLAALINGSKIPAKFEIKNETYLVGKAFICKYVETEEDYEFIPMFAICERKGKYTLLVNKDIQNNNLKPLVKKVVTPLMNNYDVIWTNNLNKYFCDLDLPSFKSLKEKKEFLNELVEEFQREGN